MPERSRKRPSDVNELAKSVVDAGPVGTFTTLEEARNELEAVLDDEPGWITRLWIEPFTLTVTEKRD